MASRAASETASFLFPALNLFTTNPSCPFALGVSCTGNGGLPLHGVSLRGSSRGRGCQRRKHRCGCSLIRGASVFCRALLVFLVPVIDTLELNTVFAKCIAGRSVNKPIEYIVIEGIFQPKDLHIVRLILLAGFHQITVKGCEQFIDGFAALFQCAEVVHCFPLEFLVHVVEIKMFEESGHCIVVYRSGRIGVGNHPWENMASRIARQSSISIPEAFIGTTQSFPVNVKFRFQEMFEVLIGSNISPKHLRIRQDLSGTLVRVIAIIPLAHSAWGPR
ncbi:uncharacterized protein ACHE_11941S [Aspergillus chevalieri]|uniref:Uncharacterized protein n=1 Tax=Aspergillus chevalieri TaxID=182096 RepID=A0A7R7VH41_ASPCH|nr:uncharacterized protein ACHE_11941S [Aspergillus chevalieri]BCR84539.1 hypothetical protein ACHE_11941S [Aspergillus chevalieri]